MAFTIPHFGATDTPAKRAQSLNALAEMLANAINGIKATPTVTAPNIVEEDKQRGRSVPWSSIAGIPALTPNYIPKAATATTLGDGPIAVNGSSIGIGMAPADILAALHLQVASPSVLMRVTNPEHASHVDFGYYNHSYDKDTFAKIGLNGGGASPELLFPGTSAVAFALGTFVGLPIQFVTNNTLRASIDGTTGEVSIANVNDGGTQLLTWDSEGLKVTRRTFAETLSDIAALPLAGGAVAGRLSAANSMVVARLSTPLSIAKSSATTVIYNIELTDALGEYDVSTGIFTASRACKVSISWYVTSAATAWAAGEQWASVLFHNAVQYIGHYTVVEAAITDAIISSGHVDLLLVANDTLQIKVYQNHAAGAVYTYNSAASNYLSIVEIP